MYAYLICEDQKVADDISVYEMSQEEIGEVARATSSEENDESGEDASDEEGLMTLMEPEETFGEHLGNVEEDYLEVDYEMLESPLSLLSCTMINLRVS